LCGFNVTRILASSKTSFFIIQKHRLPPNGLRYPLVGGTR
jgi:hypothetical protein